MRILGSPAGTLLLCSLSFPLAATAGGDEPDEIQRLLASGQASYLRADYDAARESYLGAWKLAQETAPANPIRYDVLKRLTGVDAAAGQDAEAEGYLQQALTWRENQFGSLDPKAIEDLIEVSTLCRRQKDFDRALLVLERVSILHVRSAGAESLPVADDMSRKAQIYVDQKQPESAAAALTDALTIRNKLSGADSPTLLSDLDRLGEIYISLRQYDKAEESYRHALVIRERLYGREHADLIGTLDGLAYACFGQRKYAEAEPLYHRLLAVWSSSARKDHPMVATVLDKLAGFYGEQKKWELAKEAADRANTIRAHFMALGFAQEAELRLAEGASEAAKDLYRRALAVMDPPDAIFDELRGKVEDNLKLLEPPPRPVKPRPVKSAPRKK